MYILLLSEIVTKGRPNQNVPYPSFGVITGTNRATHSSHSDLKASGDEDVLVNPGYSKF